MTLKHGRHFNDNDQPRTLIEPPYQDCRHIVLRGPENGDWTSAISPQIDYPVLNEWPTARNLLADVMSKITTHLAAENLQFGQVVVRSLQPGGFINWYSDEHLPYAQHYSRFQLLVSACAGGCWYSGGEALGPGPGNLTFINHVTLNSAINLGPVPQIFLVADVRKPEQPTLQ